MATSPSSSASDASKSPVAAPLQKKILQDVLECVVQLKTAFFDNQQPITDDSVVLQRFCAKFEHLIWVGMKEKTSLLGRKKDYWDYFCECLASAKGSNDGIRFVKSLNENKTSLGRGRAFIRFCLVHQRLADSLQQCVSHGKTVDWFSPNSVLVNGMDCQRLVNSLYDLNALHFDLSPRGYDLDTAWPTFSNRKPGPPSGSWNVPLSRRSSVTSMDTVSQISMSVGSADIDRLTKDLEVAQNTKSELIGRIDALQMEKEQVSQSAWATHGEMQALQQQLRHLQSQNASLQERYKELDISHMKLKLEKEHAERVLRDEIKILNEKFKDEESKRVSQLQSEEEIWKTEVREEGERRKREIDRLQKELELKVLEASIEKERSAEQGLALKNVIVELNTKHQIEHSEKEARLVHLESQLLGLEQALRESQESQVDLNNRVTSSELELQIERDRHESLQREESLIETKWKQQEVEVNMLKEERVNTINKTCELEKRYNDLLQKRDEICCKLDEVERLNVELKNEMEKRDAEIKHLISNKGENEKMVNELSQIVEQNSAQLKNKETELQNCKEIFERKKEEVMVLKQSSEGQATDLEMLLQKRNEALQEAARELEALRKEVEEEKNGNVLLGKNMAAAEKQISSLESENKKMEEIVIGLEAEIAERRMKAEVKDEAVKDAEMEIEKLRNELMSAKENLVSAMSLIDSLHLQKSESEIETENVRVELKILQAENDKLKRDVDSEKSRILGLLQNSEKVKQLEGEEQVKVESLIFEMDKFRKEKEDNIFGLEVKIKNLTIDISDKSRKIGALDSEIEILKSMLQNERLSVENKESELQKLKFEKNESELTFKNIISVMESKAEEIKLFHQNEAASCAKIIKNLELRLSENERDLEMKCVAHEELIKGLNEELAKTSSQGSDNINKLTSELVTLTEERDRLQTHTNTAQEENIQLKCQLAETLEKLASTYTQLEIVVADKTSLDSELTSMSEELNKMLNEKDILAREVNSMKISLQVVEDEVQERLSQKRKVEHELEEVKVHLEKVVAENVELGIQVEGYQSQTEFSTKVLEESVVEAKGRVEQLTLELVEIQDKFESAVKDREDLKNKLEKTEKELSNQIDSLNEKNDRIDESEVFKLKEELSEERQKHLSVVESLNEEISALQFQLSAELMTSLDTSQTTASKSETTIELMRRVSDMEVIIEQLERELESLRKAKDMDSNQAKSNILQVQEIKKLLLSKQEECDALQNQLSQSTSKLIEETSMREKVESDHRLLRRSYNKDVETRDLEISNLKSDNEQIKKKLVKLIKDKDTLWHKTDELVTEQKRIMGDRWQDNERVTHCPQCKLEFSLFLRKHHCRVCGRIFCWSCSDYWVETPYSSKKIRACSPCFHHNTNLGTTLVSTSMIHPESDSDEDDEVAENGDVAQKDSSNGSSRIISTNSVVSSTQTLTNEIRIHQSADSVFPSNTPPASADPSDAEDAFRRDGSSDRTSDDSLFQILDQESVMKSISSYNDAVSASEIPPNMTSSILLQADDLSSGEINQQSEVWIKPGKSFILPVHIDQHNTALIWEFSSQTKDIVFSVNYRANEMTAFGDADEIIAPCKCDSHKQTVRGELTAKQSGIYTLVFDNTYSRATSKKIHYRLEYKK